MKGKIKFFNVIKKYGFIVKEDNKDIFFHMDGFVNQPDTSMIEEGVEVSFKEVKDMKGNKAIEIQILEEEKNNG